jgi:hypothetical protein
MRYLRALADRRGAGRARTAAVAAVLALAILGGCYSFSGGGGLPSHIQTAYVAPVENQSTRFGLSESLTEQLLEAARQRLGLRLADEQDADAVIRATIRSFTDDAVNFDAVDGVGADIFQRRVTIAATVEIVDRQADEIIWSSQGLSGAGEYEPGSETEEQGTQVALENLVQKIVDGAQSQW